MHNLKPGIQKYSLFEVDLAGKKQFGLSYYSQIHANLLEKTKEVTRSEVQKAVVVLLNLPLQCYIQQKVLIVTNALFNQRDFKKTEILNVF